MTSERKRIAIVSVFCSLLALLIVVRLFYLQVVKGDSFSERVANGANSTTTSFNRGGIFFTHKDGTLVSAATTVSGYTVVVEKAKAKNNASLINALAAIVEDDAVVLDKKLSQSPSRHVPLIKEVTQSQADEIRALKLEGVSLKPDKWRFYPGKQLGARTLGFVAFKDDALEGRYGIERYYNDTLSRDPENIYGNFFTEVFSNINKTIASDSFEGNVVTTLEPQVQQKLESHLLDVQKKYSADGAGGIIMDPKTGRVLAMTYLPTFDLNEFGSVEHPSHYANPNVENVYEFGSVMKPLVMAAAIDQGVVNASTTYVDKGELTLNNKTIHNFDKKARGTATMQDVLNQSLNTGMVFVEQKMGKESFRNYMLAYGIGEKTGIDLPNETRGLVGNLKSNRDIEFATAAFGQGIAVTPIEAARAFSSLANGGVLLTPYVVESIELDSGKKEEITKNEPVQVISKKASDEITRMLVTVVDKGLNAGTYKNEHYSVAAKTGTAQMAMENGRGYYEDRYLHSLFGYYPAYNPRFLVLMYIVNPKGVRFASSTMADPFFDLSKFLLSYYEVPPDR